MPSTSNILERLRWKVGLGLVIVAAGFAAQAAPSAPANDLARSSWGLRATPNEASRQVQEALPESTDVARSSWGIAVEASDEA